MPKSNNKIGDDAERMRLYEIFVAAGIAGSHKNIASIAALGGIAEDEPVVKTYRSIDLKFDPESQTLREAGDVSGGRAGDKKTLVLQL